MCHIFNICSIPPPPSVGMMWEGVWVSNCCECVCVCLRVSLCACACVHTSYDCSWGRRSRGFNVYSNPIVCRSLHRTSTYSYGVYIYKHIGKYVYIYTICSEPMALLWIPSPFFGGEKPRRSPSGPRDNRDIIAMMLCGHINTTLGQALRVRVKSLPQ